MDVWAAITLPFALGLSLAFAVPLTGALVRFRANYNPKALQLDEEGGAQAHTGPIITSYFGMLMRVYRLEGWPGMYKGFMPTFLAATLVIFFMTVVLGISTVHHGDYTSPPSGVVGTLFYAFFMMILQLPVGIITYRSITTPHRLPYFRPMHSLRVLLTPTERARPWVLYMTPGLMAARMTHMLYVILIMSTIRRFLLPGLTDFPTSSAEDFSPIRIIFFFLLVIISTVILAPLEVIATRLAIQRNHSAAGFNSVSQEVDGDAEESAEYAGADEDVIGLRSDEDPYSSMLDCGKRIVDEEGWRALYRAWWLTGLGALGGALS